LGMPPKRLKEVLALDHTDRLLRLSSDPGFTEDLLGGTGIDAAWLDPGPRIGHLRHSCDPLGRGL
jgi:hypothetical protein